MLKIRTLLQWFDEYALLVLAYFLIAFIPLYPKLPLFDIIPGYIVRVRLEDFFVLLAGLIWFIQFLRKKIVWKTPVTWVIAAYAVVGILSTISAVLITKTVPAELIHVGKTLLHYFRYLEYFSLFFLAASSLKTNAQFKALYGLICVTLLGLAVYGYGQRYWYWPVYSTMNREFSKGITLYLSEHARVQSTFGGHYDLAAYLVVVLPIVLAGILFIKPKLMKFLLTIIYIAGVWLIIQTASRSSSLGFIIASYIVIGIYALHRATWWQRFFAFTKYSIVYSILFGLLVLQFGDDIYERFLQTLKAYPELHDRYHAMNKQRKELVSTSGEYILNHVLSAGLKDKWLSWTQPKPPEHGISTEQALVMVNSDTQPSPNKPTDVFVEVPVTKLVATESATGEITIKTVSGPRDYSGNALAYGLSAGIRYDTLWPRAIAGFKTNPLLGSGYATLTKESTIQFTEAESTDNNFLRTLGETGLMGFLTFYGVVVIMILIAIKLLKKAQNNVYIIIFAVGFIASSIGLLINAIYIDVFAASKVAFTFWAMAGAVAAAYLHSTELLPVVSIATSTKGEFLSALKGVGHKPQSKKKQSKHKRKNT